MNKTAGASPAIVQTSFTPVPREVADVQRRGPRHDDVAGGASRFVALPVRIAPPELIRASPPV
jgi:hypothetical protein